MPAAIAKAFNLIRHASPFPAFTGTTGQIDMIGNTLRTISGQSFDETGALRVAAIYIATTVLADEIASLSYRLIARTDKTRTPLQPDNLAALWSDDPNDIDTRFSIDATETLSLMLAGKSYTMLEWTRANSLNARWPQDPGACTLELTDNGMRLKVSGKGELNNVRGKLPEFCYIPLYTLPGKIESVSPVQMAAELAGLSLSYQESAARLMQRGFNPSAVVTLDEAIDDSEAERLARRLERLHGGARRAGGIAVLGGRGLKLDKLGMSMADAEFVAQNEQVFKVLLAMWRVPPTVAGMVDKPSTWGTGIAEFSRGLERFTLRPITKRRESAYQKFITRPVDENLTVRYVFDSLLSAAPKDKNEIQRQSLQAGMTSVERVLAQNDEPPFDPDETVFTQLSLANDDSMGFRDQRARATALTAEAQAVSAMQAAGVPLRDAWEFVNPDAPFIDALQEPEASSPPAPAPSAMEPPEGQLPGGPGSA